MPDHPNPFRQDGDGKPAQCLGFVKVPVEAAFAEEVRGLRPAEKPHYWLAPEQIGTESAWKQRSYLNDRNRPPLTEGQGLDAMARRSPIIVFPFGNWDYFLHRFIGSDRTFATDTVQVYVDLGRPGMMFCGAMPFDVKAHGLTVFYFPDGAAPPTAVRPFDDTTIISDDGYLYLQTPIYFSIEGGLEDHE